MERHTKRTVTTLRMFLIPDCLLLGLLFAVSIGCVAEISGNRTLRTLARGAFSGIQEPLQKVVKTQTAWDALWALHSRLTSPPSPSPAVHFDREMVIAVTLGRQRTGGYAIEVIGVEPVGGKLRILVRRSTPPPGAMLIQALTSPFDFVAVPVSDLPPEFVEVKGHRIK